MDIEAPEAVDVLVRSIDSNSNAIKELIRMVKKLREEVRDLKEKVEKTGEAD